MAEFLIFCSLSDFYTLINFLSLSFRPDTLGEKCFRGLNRISSKSENDRKLGSHFRAENRKNRAVFRWNNALVQPQTAAIGEKLKEV